MHLALPFRAPQQLKPKSLGFSKADAVDGSRFRRCSAKVVLSRSTSLEPSRWRSRLWASTWPRTFFQVHAIGNAGEVVFRRALRRAQVIPFFSKLPPCLIGMEACGTSHHWA